MNRRIHVIAIALLVSGLASCGKSSEQVDQENATRQAALQKALANSRAEEREKDRRMREGAAAQATERIERETAEHEQEVAKAAAATAAIAAMAAPVPFPSEPKQADRVADLAKYTDRLKQAVSDPASVQLRNAELSPKQNGMCGEFNAKNKADSYAGFKRVVVTDSGVTPEEPPTKELLAKFLAFQIAARDTGCFPDVLNVHILQ